MSQIYDVLIINGYPITTDALNNTLSKSSLSSIFFNVSTSSTISNSIKKIGDTCFDLIIIDTNLPKSEVSKIKSIEDLYNHIKHVSHSAKIIILTAYKDNLRLLNILRKINPDGLLLKSDITKYDLLQAAKCVIQGNPFYSNSINKLLRKKMSQTIVIDPIDTDILKELSNGSKMGELLKLIPLTKSGIEKRKRRLKSVFQTNSNSDRELVITARERGFI